MIRIIKRLSKPLLYQSNDKKRPTLVYRDKTPIVEDGILYGGCYVNASIDRMGNGQFLVKSWLVLTRFNL